MESSLGGKAVAGGGEEVMIMNNSPNDEEVMIVNNPENVVIVNNPEEVTIVNNPEEVMIVNNLEEVTIVNNPEEVTIVNNTPQPPLSSPSLVPAPSKTDEPLPAEEDRPTTDPLVDALIDSTETTTTDIDNNQEGEDNCTPADTDEQTNTCTDNCTSTDTDEQTNTCTDTWVDNDDVKPPEDPKLENISNGGGGKTHYESS